MKIQFMSDIHQEFELNEKYMNINLPKPVAPIMILAGDITYLGKRFYRNKLFDHFNENWEKTLIVPGNHEYYNSVDMTKTKVAFGGEIQIRDRVFIVNKHHEKIEDVHFILTTLWSDIRPINTISVSSHMNDFYTIKTHGERFTVPTYNLLHRTEKKWLMEKVNELKGRKIVVVTHHLPTRMLIEEKYKGKPTNDGFATELGDFIVDSKISTWIFGHSHGNMEVEIGTTKIISNQLGYVKKIGGVLIPENEKFNPNKYIEI